MKSKLVIYITLSLVLWSCDKSADSPDPSEEIDLLSVEVPNNFFGGEFNVMSSAKVFLTNDTGQLITSAELSNNFTTVLKSDFDNLSSNLTLTYLLKLEHNNGTSYKAFTFNNIDLLDLKFTEPEAENVIKEKAYLKLTNTNGKVETLPFDFYPFFDEATIYQDSTVFRFELDRTPQNLYFKVQHEQEEFIRYVMLNDVEPNSITEIQFSDLPQFAENKTFTYPDNDYIRTTIYGAEKEHPDYFYAKLVDFYSIDGLTSHNTFFPDIVFDQFKVNRTIKRNGVTYHSSSIDTSLDLNFALPDMSFERVDNDINNYKIAATGNFDFYSTVFTYYTESVDFSWYVYGEGNSDIHFLLPNLEKEYKNEIPDLSFNLLTNNGAGIYKFEGLNSYKEFILSRLDVNYDYSLQKTESVSKTF